MAKNPLGESIEFEFAYTQHHQHIIPQSGRTGKDNITLFIYFFNYEHINNIEKDIRKNWWWNICIVLTDMVGKTFSIFASVFCPFTFCPLIFSQRVLPYISIKTQPYDPLKWHCHRSHGHTHGHGQPHNPTSRPKPRPVLFPIHTQLEILFSFKRSCLLWGRRGRRRMSYGYSIYHAAYVTFHFLNMNFHHIITSSLTAFTYTHIMYINSMCIWNLFSGCYWFWCRCSREGDHKWSEAAIPCAYVGVYVPEGFIMRGRGTALVTVVA